MTFLNKSVNYSQTTLLKSSILAPLLKNYNEFLLQSKGKSVVLNQDVNTGISYDYIIPNNNKKYYLLITKKSYLESSNFNSSKEEFVRRQSITRDINVNIDDS